MIFVVLIDVHIAHVLHCGAPTTIVGKIPRVTISTTFSHYLLSNV
jgi:hypothetical protein